jgi:hypothetical protein
MGQGPDSPRSALAAAGAVAPGREVGEAVGGPVQDTVPSERGDHEGEIGEVAGVVVVGGQSSGPGTACLGDPVWDWERLEEPEWGLWLAPDHTGWVVEAGD